LLYHTKTYIVVTFVRLLDGVISYKDLHRGNICTTVKHCYIMQRPTS